MSSNHGKEYFFAEQITEQAEYCARSLGAADVAPLKVIVAPAPGGKSHLTCRRFAGH
jgi:hypothetical protein